MPVRRLAVFVPALAASLIATGAPPAAAQSSPFQSAAGPGTPAGQGGPPGGSSGPSAAEIAAARASIAARREWLKSPQAARERSDSRQAFSGLGRERAQEVAERHHPNVLRSRLWAPLGLARDATVKYVSDVVARLEYEDGSVGSVISQVPLRARSRETGLLGPADIELRPSDRGFRARNPLVDVVAPTDAAGALQISDEIALEVDGAAASGGVLRDGRVFYANALPDSDLVVLPDPSGAETFFVVRSAAAPRSYTIRPSSGSASVVRPNVDPQDPAAARLVADGETLATVEYPTAVDAQGQSVPVDVAVIGNSLRISLPEDLDGFAFPIALDPTVHMIPYAWRDGGRTNFAGWTAGQSNPASRYCTWMGAPYWYNGNGYYTYDRTGYTDPCAQTSFAAPEIHELNYYGTGPWHERTGISAYAAELTEYFDPGSPGGVCRYSGIYGDPGRWEPGTYSGNQCGYAWGTYRAFCVNSNCSTPTSTPRNYVVMGTVMVTSGNKSYYTHHRSGAAIYVSDIDTPTLSTTLASTWQRDGSFQVTGTDKGLGTQRLKVTTIGTGAPAWSDTVSTCGIDPDNGCAMALAKTINVSDFSTDGSFPLTATATDAGGTASPATGIGTARIDRSKPELSVTGELRSPGVTETGQDLYSLTVVAKDGTPGGPPSGQASGVSRVVMTVGGLTFEKSADSGCLGDSCGLTVVEGEWELDTDDLPEGTHTVQVAAYDKAGNPPATDTWQIVVPRDATFRSRLAAWKTAVANQVDQANPAPLNRPLPTPPTDWSTPSACETDESSFAACFDRIENWRDDVRKWLEENPMLTTSPSSLPRQPTFAYARNRTSVRLSDAMRDGFDYAVRSAASPTDRVRVAINFDNPVTPSDLASVVPGVNVDVQFRGSFDPAGYNITSVQRSSLAAGELNDHIEQFYVSQRAQNREDIADFAREIAGEVDGVAPSTEEKAGLEKALAGENAYGQRLDTRGALISGLEIEAVIGTLPASLKSRNVGVRSIHLVSDASRGGLNEAVPNRELVAVAQRSRPSSSQSPSAYSSAVGPPIGARSGPTCAERGESARTKVPPPTLFAPSAFGAKVALYGAQPNPEGNYRKRASTRSFFGLHTQGLSWYCGDDTYDRGFEPETKATENANRPKWATDHASGFSKEWKTNMLDAYQDDLNNRDGELAEYPDFGIGTSAGHALEYGVIYYTRNILNNGFTNDGETTVRVQGTGRGRGKEYGYCKLKGGVDRSCYFGKRTCYVDVQQLRIPRIKWYRPTWGQAQFESSHCDPERRT